MYILPDTPSNTETLGSLPSSMEDAKLISESNSSRQEDNCVCVCV